MCIKERKSTHDKIQGWVKRKFTFPLHRWSSELQFIKTCIEREKSRNKSLLSIIKEREKNLPIQLNCKTNVNHWKLVSFVSSTYRSLSFFLNFHFIFNWRAQRRIKYLNYFTFNDDEKEEMQWKKKSNNAIQLMQLYIKIFEIWANDFLYKMVCQYKIRRYTMYKKLQKL